MTGATTGRNKHRDLSPGSIHLHHINYGLHEKVVRVPVYEKVR